MAIFRDIVTTSMDKSLFLKDIIAPEEINKENYKYLLTIKYENEISEACVDLQETLGIEYISICLTLPNNRKQIISNNPGNIAIPYQINGLVRLDNVFDISSYDHHDFNFFSAKQIKHDACSKIYEQIMNERFNVYNAFGFYREYDGYKFMCVFARKKESVAPKLNFSTEKSIMNVVWKFLNQILPYYQQENGALKYSRISQDASFRKNFIFGQYKSTLPELKDRERECLFWARYGKSTSETSEILGLKRATVKNYLEGVREKFHVSSVQEAITLALQNQIIS